MDMKYFASIIILWITLTTPKICQAEKYVQAVSEGSDCSCKCILTIKDGGLCEESLVGGPRKSIYLVETISGGKDCRCSCNTPPPGECGKMPIPVTSKASHDYRVKERRKPLQEIDLIELHGSISDMVTAMIKLEKAVAKKTSKKNLELLRNNVKKVVSNLKSTNGSYANLLTDLNLNDHSSDTDDDEIIKDGAAATNEFFETVTEPSQKTTNIEEVTTRNADLIGVSPLKFPKLTVRQDTFDPLATPRSDIISEKGESVKDFVASEVSTPSTESLPSKHPTRFDSLLTTTVADIVSNNTTLEYNKPEMSHLSENQSNSSNSSTHFNIAASKEEEVTTVPLNNNQSPVKPEIIFVPYRSVEDNSKKEAKISSTKNEAKHNEYEYDYEYFDVDSKKNEPKLRNTTQKVTTVKAKIGESPTLHTALTKTNTSTTTTTTPTTSTVSTTTEDHNAYRDYLAEYDSDDEEENYDYLEDEATTGLTTTTTTTTATIATTTHADKCGTLFSLSRPTSVSHFGRREGAWMRDPIPSKTDPTRTEKIYIANFYYGSNLIEFDSIEGVRKLQYKNSYSLPHRWMGTGHIVYNGSFYYNRAFSRTLIKYNLRYRFVSAWSHLANAVYHRKTPFTWRGHSMVHMAADEDGLWVIFPAKNPFDDDAKLTYVINKINPIDLRIIESYKSNIRQSVSHVFMICGVVYSTDRYNTRNARVTHAFDTRTLVQRSIYLGFENLFSFTVQFLYNPKERKIYAWDNGRQVEYGVNLLY